MKLSIKAATKIWGISLDWLVDNTYAELDTAILNRIQNINKLFTKDKELVYELLDSFIANRKIKNVLQKTILMSFKKYMVSFILAFLLPACYSSKIPLTPEEEKFG